jgi:uracil-DNA glycosylase family 4
MIDFPTHNDCQECPLHLTATNPGIPTSRLFFDGEECDYEVRRDKAIVFVGQGPGHNEDVAGRGWVGYAGGLLQKFVALSGMREYADVYVTNATRCKPPQKSVPTDGQVNVCRKHLEKDLDLLRPHYKEIVLVGCGSKAAKSIGRHRSLGSAVRRQGVPGVWPDCSCFYTNNPAILHPSRSPSLVKSVEDHFRLIIRYLKGEFIPNDLSIKPLVGCCVPKVVSGDIVTFDIESYGILKGKEQTVFNPEKSLLVDGVPYREQVVTCAFGWRDSENILRTSVYRMDRDWHRYAVYEWFRFLSHKGITLVGQNTKFDLMYIRKAMPVLYNVVNPLRLKVDDTMLVSFLEYEQRPERGLKELATLLGITDYSSSGVTGKEGNAEGYGDPKLLEYNCLDAAVTYILYEEMTRRLVSRFGDQSAKNSELCRKMRNMVVWTVFDLERNGSSLNMEQLREVHRDNNERKKQVVERAKQDYEIKLCGTGSDKPLREFFLQAIKEAGLEGDDRVEYTKTGGMSIAVANSNLLLKYIPDGTTREILNLFQEYKDRAKITNTYTKPLLNDKRRGIVSYRNGIGMVYPSWYPIPSYSSRGGANDPKSMGQIQGRYSVSGPARHTEPKTIRNCSCSRFRGGTLAEYDMSQDHLRMAALLSNDPVLYSAYRGEGESLHTMTAMDIFEDADPTSAGWKDSKEYHLGKTLNFLILFRGGPDTYVQTARRDTGFEITREFARRSIDTWYATHPVFKEWQDNLLEEAKRDGFIETVTGWSRTFAIGAEGIQNSVNEICNCAIQIPCAQCTQSSQYEIICEFQRRRMKSILCLQIHDSVFVDQYPGEEELVDSIVTKHMERPPVLAALEQQLMRTIPFVCEKKVYQSKEIE